MKVKLQNITNKGGVGQARHQGFTLMEMLLVLMIITMLVALGAYTMKDVVGDADETAAEAGVATLQSTLIRYRTKTGMFPTTAQGLQAMVTRPTTNPIPKKWKELLNAKSIVDPWDNPYQYKKPGIHNKNSYDIYSFGPDGVESEDDIGNWE